MNKDQIAKKTLNQTTVEPIGWKLNKNIFTYFTGNAKITYICGKCYHTNNLGKINLISAEFQIFYCPNCGAGNQFPVRFEETEDDI